MKLLLRMQPSVCALSSEPCGHMSMAAVRSVSQVGDVATTSGRVPEGAFL